MFHIPVLCSSIISLVSSKKDELFFVVDATVGSGGHLKALLQQYGDVIKHIWAVDRDFHAINIAKGILGEYQEKISFRHQCFSQTAKDLKLLGLYPDVIVMDLGVSSMQLIMDRGFSFREDSILDMRMGDSTITGKDILNNYSRRELIELFVVDGEIPWGMKLVKKILEYRSKQVIETTQMFVEIILKVMPYKKWGRKNIHPATIPFQALRMAVNSERQELESGLKDFLESLNVGGMLLAISFHSIEDRIVKNMFRNKINERGPDCFWKLLNKKPIVPSEAEIQENIRCRSSKLRGIQKCAII